MAESKWLVWCTDDNPLRLVCMLEWTWSMGHLFWDVLFNSYNILCNERASQGEFSQKVCRDLFSPKE